MSVFRRFLGGMIVALIGVGAAAEAPLVSLRPEARTLLFPAPVAAEDDLLRPEPRGDEGFLSTRGLTSVSVMARPRVRPPGLADPPPVVLTGAAIRPMARTDVMPEAAWDHRPGTEAWTEAAWDAFRDARRDITEVVPRDIAAWCPAYVQNGPDQRRAFWVGLMSALARHESTWNPRAVGGGGQWYGLLQIYPPTADHFGCAADTGRELTDPEANLACAARIMSVTVTRDNAVALHDGRWRGVAADWGPMTNEIKREQMMAWTREQDYCRPVLAVARSLLPLARPWVADQPLRVATLRPAERPAGLVPPVRLALNLPE